MITRQEIQDLKKYLVEERHAQRITNQKEDYTYYDDTFPLPLVLDPNYIIRTGAPARLIDNMVEQIVTSNPQVFTDAKKDTATSRDASARMAKEFNRWAVYLNKQNPNPYKQSLKNLLVRGDSYIYVVHNENLEGNWQEEYPDAIPARFLPYDPLVVFFDPDYGEEYGIPNRVIVSFERMVADIQRSYPKWRYDGLQKNVDFTLYFDKELRYFEAAGIPLFEEDFQPNIYGVVPFVHSYSGFGFETANKDPASMAISRIHKIKDMYREDCTMRSDFATIIHKYAYKHFNVINRSGKPLEKSALDNFTTKAGTISELMLPANVDIEVSKDMLPEQAVFNYYAMIRGDISAEDAPILHGLSVGSSGRQDDISLHSGLKLYDSVINNTAVAWATAFDMAAKMMGLPNMRPSGIKKGDVDEYTGTRLELRSIDPLDAERSSLSGRAQVQAGQLSLKTNFMRHQRMTEEQADEEIAQMMAEAYMLKNPEIAMFIGSKVAEKSGMADELAAYQEQLKSKPSEVPLGRQIGSQGGEPRIENIQTPQGAEQVDLTKFQRGVRNPPAEVS